jgi:alpha-galactosidase
MEQKNIVLQRDKIKIELDREGGTVVVCRKDGAVAFGPLLSRVKFKGVGGKAFDPVSSLVDGWRAKESEVETPAGAGPGFRAVLGDVQALPVRITWEAALTGGEDAVARVAVENTGAHPIRLYDLVPLGYRGADPGLDMGAGYMGWRFYRTGYQSWSPAGSISVMDEDYKPRFFLPSRAGTNPRTPYSNKPGEKASDWMAQVVDTNLSLSTLMGFITSARMAGRIEFEVKYDRFRRLEAVSDGDGMVVDPGETVSSEWLLLSLSDDPLAQQARYYELWGKAMNARKCDPPSGWCTWYFSFVRVTENTVNRNLASLGDLKGLVEFVQIDDGYEPWPGTWTDWNRKFPTPPAETAQRIKDAGFRPGLWLAPFFVSQESPLYRRHPDWVLRSKRGWPLVAFIHPAWAGHIIYALDVTNPEVQKWLSDTVKTLVHEFGFEYLKLDFLYAAALPGERHDKKATGAMALRKGLEAIREAAGEDTLLLGCGCPLGPAIGIVDVMRVSQDVDIRWKIPLMDFVSGIPTGPGARNCLKNNLARALMHDALWANDPDCVVMRDVRGGMAEHEIQSELTVMYLSGGQVFLSEDVPGLPKQKLEWLKRMLPPSGEAAIPLDLFEKDFPEILFLAKGDSALVALFNWSGSSRELKLDFNRLGLEGSWHVFDYWAENHLGAHAERLSLGKVPARGCKYLRLVRADGKPRLLATNLHMGMGEVGFEVNDRDKGLEVDVKLPGKRSGTIWTVMSGGKLEARKLEFTDNIKSEI